MRLRSLEEPFEETFHVIAMDPMMCHDARWFVRIDLSEAPLTQMPDEGAEGFFGPGEAPRPPIHHIDMNVRAEGVAPRPERGKSEVAQRRQARGKRTVDAVPGRDHHGKKAGAEQPFKLFLPGEEPLDDGFADELAFALAGSRIVGMRPAMLQHADRQIEGLGLGWNDGERERRPAAERGKALEGRRDAGRVVVAPPERRATAGFRPSVQLGTQRLPCGDRRPGQRCGKDHLRPCQDQHGAVQRSKLPKNYP